MDLHLQKVAHWRTRIFQWAVRKGWWPDDIKTRSVAELVSNFHGEVSEAWEEYRENRMDIWWSFGKNNENAFTKHADNRPDLMIEYGWKPEGFWIEIADLCIRVLDTLGAYRLPLPESPKPLLSESQLPAPIFVLRLHDMLAKLTICEFSEANVVWEPNGQCDWLLHVLAFCEQQATLANQNIWDLIELKHTYNLNRPYRHGNKQA